MAAKREVPDVRFRLRITAGDRVAIGPGKIALLEAIEATGSITAAAKRLDMSYRRAWLLLDEMNGSLAEPAVSASAGGSRGGGSRLTGTGRTLIRRYRDAEATALRACRADLRGLLSLLKR